MRLRYRIVGNQRVEMVLEMKPLIRIHRKKERTRTGKLPEPVVEAVIFKESTMRPVVHEDRERKLSASDQGKRHDERQGIWKPSDQRKGRCHKRPIDQKGRGRAKIGKLA